MTSAKLSGKTALLLASILALALLVIVAPFLQGIRIESQVKRDLAAVNRALAPLVSVEVATYQRHWFDSRVNANLRLDIGKTPTRLPLSFRIVHGPAPIAEIARGAMRPRLFKALIQSERRVSAVEVDGLMDIRGDLDLKLLSPRVVNSEASLTWGGGRVEISSQGDSEDIRVKARLKGWSSGDKDKDKRLEAGTLKVDFHGEKKNRAATLEARLSSLAFKLDGWRFDLRAISGAIAQKGRAQKLPLGIASFTLKNAAIKYAGDAVKKVDWKLSGVTFAAESGVQDVFARVSGRWRVNRWAGSKDEYGPIDIDVSAARLSVATLSAIVDRWDELRFLAKEKDQARAEVVRSKLEKTRGELKNTEPLVDFSFKVKKAEQTASWDLQYVVEAKKKSTQDPSKADIVRTRGVMNLDLAADLAEAGLSELVDLYVKRAGHFESDTEQDRNRILQNLISGLTEKRVLIREGDRYRGRIEWNEGNIKVNQKPIDPWSLIKALAVWTAITKPVYTLQIKKYEVQGGLSKEQVMAAIKEQAKEIRGCIWKENQKEPRPTQNEIDIEWEIDKAGLSKPARIAFTAAENPGLGACIQKLLDPVRYPRSRTDSRVSLNIAYEIE